MQGFPVKPISLEEAVKLIQIAERARQGRLRAIFMKQIFLQEYRARQAKILSQKATDVGIAALRIQKVRVRGHWSWGQCVMELEVQPTVGSRAQMQIPKSSLQ